MMKKSKLLRKGGLDTILAYVVVSIPLFYVLIFMIATIYHFSVQMHLNQSLKETLIMASSYGQITPEMFEWLFNNIDNVGDGGTKWQMRIGIRTIDDDGDITGLGTDPNITVYPSSTDVYSGITKENVRGIIGSQFKDPNIINKGNLVSIELISEQPSLLSNVSNFSVFGNTGSRDLRYSSYREEIIANENPDG